MKTRARAQAAADGGHGKRGGDTPRSRVAAMGWMVVTSPAIPQPPIHLPSPTGGGAGDGGSGGRGDGAGDGGLGAGEGGDGDGGRGTGGRGDGGGGRGGAGP